MPRTKKQNEEIRNKTRNAILSSSLKLFANKGFHGTSISDISKTAGISKGLAYNYFESKEKILDAIFAEALNTGNNLQEQLEIIKDPYEKLEFIIKAMFDDLKNQEEYWRLYFAISLQPEIFETSQSVNLKFAEFFLKIIEKIFKEIKVKYPMAEARIFFAGLDGLGLQYFFYRGKFPYEKMKKYYLNRYSKEGIKKLK
ncbi:MAG TPA: TetR/AcrR family transcriptional regulator [Ignavibacteriaceae bacterium]|nr:TetR/AcrR family transcriptional regulator [Ignavibacteriaceae bacterium]